MEEPRFGTIILILQRLALKKQLVHHQEQRLLKQDLRY
jgi:hypothetical protein